MKNRGSGRKKQVVTERKKGRKGLTHCTRNLRIRRVSREKSKAEREICLMGFESA